MTDVKSLLEWTQEGGLYDYVSIAEQEFRWGNGIIDSVIDIVYAKHGTIQHVSVSCAWGNVAVLCPDDCLFLPFKRRRTSTKVRLERAPVDGGFVSQSARHADHWILDDSIFGDIHLLPHCRDGFHEKESLFHIVVLFVVCGRVLLHLCDWASDSLPTGQVAIKRRKK